MAKIAVIFDLPSMGEIVHAEEHAFVHLIYEAALRRRLLQPGDSVTTMCGYGAEMPELEYAELPPLATTIMGGEN